jgi:hypothetical protein
MSLVEIVKQGDAINFGCFRLHFTHVGNEAGAGPDQWPPESRLLETFCESPVKERVCQLVFSNDAVDVKRSI